mgnify:CR=1 FL=1
MSLELVSRVQGEELGQAAPGSRSEMARKSLSRAWFICLAAALSLMAWKDGPLVACDFLTPPSKREYRGFSVLVRV